MLDEQGPRTARMHGLWALVGIGPLEPGFHARLLSHSDPTFRAWGVRAAGNMGQVETGDPRQGRSSSPDDPSPDVRLQVAIAARKIEGIDPLPALLDVQRYSYRRSADSADRLAEPASPARRPPGRDRPAARAISTARRPGFSPLVAAGDRASCWPVPRPMPKVDRERFCDQCSWTTTDSRSPRRAGRAIPRAAACRRRSTEGLRSELIKVLRRAAPDARDCPHADDCSVLLAYCGDQEGLEERDAGDRARRRHDPSSDDAESCDRASTPSCTSSRRRRSVLLVEKHPDRDRRDPARSSSGARCSTRSTSRDDPELAPGRSQGLPEPCRPS